MPLYSFHCLNCKINFDEIIKFKDLNPVCPNCCSETERLLPDEFAFAVKGSRNRSVDCIIGADAEKRWQKIEQRRTERQKTGAEK